MSQESFPLHHRGVHVPDHLQRLELVATGGSPRPRAGGGGASFRALEPPQSRRDLIHRRDDSEPQLAAFFGNLSVWVGHAMKSATAHAGYEKVHLYLTILRVVVDEVAPHDALKRVIENVEAYVTYLSSRLEEFPLQSPTADTQPKRPLARPQIDLAGSLVGSPRSTGSVLSPRVMRAMAKEVEKEAALKSPRITTRRPKKIIELSDHEESILEIALFYKEVVAQLYSMRQTGKRHAKKNDTDTLTHRWLLFSIEKRTRVLKKIKSKITKQLFFPPPTPPGTVPPATPSGTRTTTTQPTVPGALHLELGSYFSLISLCLQETTRRINVFSAEFANFVWSVLTQDTLRVIESMFDEVLVRQRLAQEELQQLKMSRTSVCEKIAHCEQEIQRLQGQNMRSLAVWELERQEMTMLEQEEEWHGNCKPLILSSLRCLQKEVRVATWLHIHSKTADESDDNETSTAMPTEQQLASVDYRRLPLGAALLHTKLRPRVEYIAHLLVLCRSFLHLHEKRELREVMESTSTDPRWSEPHVRTSVQSDMHDSHLAIPATPQHPHANAMERISVDELLTLKDINNALRAIEELYVSVNGSGDHSSSPTTLLTAGRNVATQFPVIGSGDSPSPHGFLRSLSYSTVAAGRLANGPAFIRSGRRRNAELVVAHAPMGSGRRRGSATTLNEEDTGPVQPLIRLHKAVTKLPRHLAGVLVLPLLQSELFPPEDRASIVEALTKDEILARIQWIYNKVIETTLCPAAPANFHAGSSRHNTWDAANTTTIPLARQLWKPWRSEEFVAFTHAAFVEKYNNDITTGEREFVRFVASIQLLFSSPSAALNPSTGGSGPSQAMEKISFFSRMTRLFTLEAPDRIMKHRLPAQLFPVFFYCLHVLQTVVVTKKHIEEAGLMVDIWSVPSLPTSAEGTPSSPRSKSKRAVQQPLFANHAVHASQFVLLESVKTLLMYLLESTSPDASVVVDEQIRFLTDRATLAKVSLVSPIIPGAYEMGAGQASSHSRTSTSPPVANGEIADALILPLDVVVQTIANAWLQQHRSLVDRLSVAMRAASISSAGEISFDEFTHVMLVGAASSVATTISTGQLTQIYSSLVANGKGVHKARDGVSWRELVVAVTDEIDLLGINDKLKNMDFRSIQQALIRGTRGGAASPWVLRPAYRAGDVATLRRAWEANRPAMQENFALVFQAENALEGISMWQTGSARMERVERAFRDGNSQQARTTRLRTRRRSVVSLGSAMRASVVKEIELSEDDLAVAWHALFYLQLDHMQAHHVADHVRAKQQRAQKTNEVRGQQVTHTS